MRPTLVPDIVTRTELLARAGEVLGWVASGALALHIAREFPLAQAGEAQSPARGPEDDRQGCVAAIAVNH
jgi:NADPH2:quinone reductase